MLQQKFSDESGSASLEFITAGLLLLIPMVYLVLVISSVQGATLASEGAARQAARVFVTSENAQQASTRSQQAIDIALTDFHIPTSRASVSVSCSEPTSCLAGDSLVTISVSIDVPLPFIPNVLGLDQLAVVPVLSQATAHVSRLHGSVP
jgi:hypothetical protein